MVVFAASVCTKGGKAVLSRQFHSITRTRIESLLTSFPKLISANIQHTSIETAEVRYVYQPLEELYIVLVTNKTSNILQDIDTLNLFARVVYDMCKIVEEREIQKQSFELLGAFDEIVSLGYREHVSLIQVRNVLEMESHEEKFQEIIARNKEAEAKEELKRRACQLGMQRRERRKRAVAQGSGSYLGGGVTGYSPASRYDAPDSPAVHAPSPVPTAMSRLPQFETGGMKLGSKRSNQAELLDVLGDDVLSVEDIPARPTPVPAELPTQTKKDARGCFPPVIPESVHVVINESISVSILREDGIKSMELKGEMNLRITDASNAHIKLALAPFSIDIGSDVQFKQHPHVAKFLPNEQKIIGLKDASRAFPVGQGLAVLKWRYVGQEESYVPLSSGWLISSTNSSTTMLRCMTLKSRYPYPTVADTNASWVLNPSAHALDWSISRISGDKEERSGMLEFSVDGDDVGVFFPVRIGFVAQGSLAGIAVAGATRVSGDNVVFSLDAVTSTDEYVVL